MENSGNLALLPSPYIKGNVTTSKIMTHVMISLLPAFALSAVFFGGRALMLTGVCIISAMLFERICNLVMRKPSSVGDISAAVTGMLVGLNLPVTMPYWKACVGTFAAIVVAKQIFGGLGKNFVNPAIFGKLVLLLLFRNDMTNFVEPFYNGDTSLTAFTPLMSGNENYYNMFLGNTAGNIGEVSACALLIGACYLRAVNVIKLYTPLAYLGTVFIFSTIAGYDGLYQILAGGVILGAFFMATDPVSTPDTKSGKLIFGAGCGIITCLVRFYTDYIGADGTVISILVMNILTALFYLIYNKVSCKNK